MVRATERPVDLNDLCEAAKSMRDGTATVINNLNIEIFKNSLTILSDKILNIFNADRIFFLPLEVGGYQNIT